MADAPRNAAPPAEFCLHQLRGLLQKVSSWRDANDGKDSLAFNPSEVFVLEVALAEAVRAPALRDRLEKGEDQRYRAFRIVHDGRRPACFKDAVRFLGLLDEDRDGRPPSKRHARRPWKTLAWDYHRLTNEVGEVVIYNERLTVGREEDATFVQHCPITPVEAIRILARHYGFPSPETCRRHLHSIRFECQKWADRGDPQVKEFPELQGLPYGADDPFDE